MIVKYNPDNLELNKLECYIKKFDNNDALEEAIKHHVQMENMILGMRNKKILAFKAGLHGDDIVHDKITVLFYY